MVAQLVEHSAFNRPVLGSSPSQLKALTSLGFDLIFEQARIAQSVEQRTENPRVASSNLAPGNFKIAVLVVPIFVLIDRGSV